METDLVLNSIRRQSLDMIPLKTPRPRMQLTCEPCRLSKIKCDRRLPVCEQCRRRSRDGFCKYKDKVPRGNQGDNDILKAKEEVARLNLIINRTKETLAGVWCNETSSTLCSTPTEEASRMMGSLKLSRDGRAQLKAPCHWESIADDIADIKACIESEATNHDNASEIKEAEPIDIHLGVSSTLSRDDILSFLPEKRYMDEWVAAWLGSRHHTRIIVHWPTFQLQYNKFWESQTEADDAWLAMLVSMASMGALLTGHSRESRKDSEAAEFLRRLAAHVLIQTNVSVVRPCLIEALLVYAITSVYTNRDVLPEMWHLTSFITRLCLQAGLNREVFHSVDSGLSAFEIEMRRRVWMTARDLDISTSSISGNPCSIDPRLCDTQPPSNLTDSDFSPGHISPARPEGECTLVQIQIWYSRVMEVLGKATTLSHSVTLPCRDSIEELGSELQRLQDELPEQLRIKAHGECPSDPPSDIMYDFRFEFAFQRTRCVLYRLFLKANLDPGSFEGVGAAEAMVQCCSTLLHSAKVRHHQLGRIKLLCLRHIHDFLLAAMLICSEMNRESPTASNCTLVGQVLITACSAWLSTGLLSTRLKLTVEAIMRFLLRERTRQPSSSPTPTSQDTNATGRISSICSYAVPLSLAPEHSSFRFDAGGAFGFEFDVDG